MQHRSAKWLNWQYSQIQTPPHTKISTCGKQITQTHMLQDTQHIYCWDLSRPSEQEKGQCLADECLTRKEKGERLLSLPAPTFSNSSDSLAICGFPAVKWMWIKQEETIWMHLKNLLKCLVATATDLQIPFNVAVFWTFNTLNWWFWRCWNFLLNCGDVMSGSTTMCCQELEHWRLAFA